MRSTGIKCVYSEPLQFLPSSRRGWRSHSINSHRTFLLVNPEGVSSYCYYGGTLYSVGARLCVPGASNSYVLVCKSKDEDSDKSKTGRAVWRVDGPPAPLCKS